MRTLFLLLLVSCSGQALSLNRVQKATQLTNWVKGNNGQMRGTYQGYRAVMTDVPQADVTTLVIYASTCAAGLAAIIKENGEPDLYDGNREFHWNKTNSFLTAYCVDGVTFARLHKKI